MSFLSLDMHGAPYYSAEDLLGSALQVLPCKGNNPATAAKVAGGMLVFRQLTVFAEWADADNFAIALPTPGTAYDKTVQMELTIFASGNGAVTVFPGPDASFATGESSVSILEGTGKTFRPAVRAGALVWFYVG